MCTQFFFFTLYFLFYGLLPSTQNHNHQCSLHSLCVVLHFVLSLCVSSKTYKTKTKKKRENNRYKYIAKKDSRYLFYSHFSFIYCYFGFVSVFFFCFVFASCSVCLLFLCAVILRSFRFSLCFIVCFFLRSCHLLSLWVQFYIISVCEQL